MNDAKARLEQRSRGNKPNPMDAIAQRNAAYSAQHNPANPDVQEGEVIVKLHVTQVSPNPFQHRTSFDPVALAELAQSMRVNGQNQPIAVRKRGDRYEIIFGERRWRAAQQTEEKTVDAVVRELTDAEMIYVCLSENRDRKKAYDYETYRGISFAIKEGRPAEEIMERLGLTKNKQDYYKYMAYDNLHPDIKAFIHENPGALQRNDAAAIVKLFKDFKEEVPSELVSDVIAHMKMYLDRKISSRGEIVKRIIAKYQEKKTRNRPKLNQDFTLKLGESKVGSMVKTPGELRLTLDKSELAKDKLDELEKFLADFFSVHAVEQAPA